MINVDKKDFLSKQVENPTMTKLNSVKTKSEWHSTLNKTIRQKYLLSILPNDYVALIKNPFYDVSVLVPRTTTCYIEWIVFHMYGVVATSSYNNLFVVHELYGPQSTVYDSSGTSSCTSQDSHF
jgi:hypothetical protein